MPIYSFTNSNSCAGGFCPVRIGDGFGPPPTTRVHASANNSAFLSSFRSQNQSTQRQQPAMINRTTPEPNQREHGSFSSSMGASTYDHTTAQQSTYFSSYPNTTVPARSEPRSEEPRVTHHSIDSIDITLSGNGFDHNDPELLWLMPDLVRQGIINERQTIIDFYSNPPLNIVSPRQTSMDFRSTLSSNSLVNLVREIYQAARQAFNLSRQEQWQTFEQNNHAEDFQKFIQELHHGGKATPTDIAKVLEAVTHDSELRQFLFSYTAGELENCHDRRLLALNDIQTLAEISRLKKTHTHQNEQALAKITVGLLRQMRLREFISEKLTQHGRNSAEALEFEMLLRKKLGGVLDLPFPVNEMENQSYAEISFYDFLTEESLSEAVNVVLEAENNSSTLAEDLLNQPDLLTGGEESIWLSYLKSKYEESETMNSITQLFMQEYASIEERREASQADTTQIRAELTNEKVAIEREITLRQNDLEQAQRRYQMNPQNDTYHRALMFVHREIHLKNEKLAEIKTKLQLIMPYDDAQYDADLKRINEEMQAAKHNFYKAITLSLL